MIDFAAFENFMIQQDLSSGTIALYKKILLIFQKFLKDKGSHDFSNWDLRAFRDSLIGHAPTTINLYLNAVHCYCRSINRPDLKIKLLTIPGKSFYEDVISSETYQILLQKLITERKIQLYVFIRILATTGMRLSEALQVKLENLRNGYIDLVKTKGMRYRRVFFPSSIAEELLKLYDENCNQFPKGERYLFLEKGDELKHIAHIYEQRLYHFGKQHHIDTSVIHPHSFRHFFAKNFLSRNADIVLLADLLGHANIETTRIYLRQTRSEQKEMINRVVDW